MPGGTRRLMRARASCGTAADEPTTGGQSMPSTVAVGRAHTMSATAVAEQVDAVEHVGVRRGTAPAGYSAPGHVCARVEPADRRVAVLVAQRGEHADERRERVRGGAAEHARVHGALRASRTVTTTLRDARAGSRSGVGTPTATLPVSQTRMASARSRSGCSGTNASRPPVPCSSEPSPTIFTVTGRLARRGRAGR